MKSKNLNFKSLTTLALTLLFSLGASAASGQNIGGVSDTSLLYILLGMASLLLILVLVIANIIKSITSNKEIWEYMHSQKSVGKGLTVAALVFGFSYSAMAQAEATPAVAQVWLMSNTLFWALVSLNLFLAIVVFYLFVILKQVIGVLKAEEEQTEVAPQTVVDSWTAILTDSVPLDREEEILTDHAYDGIRELDNNLPPWWVWGFYFTIAFAFLYLMYYEFGSGPSSTQEYIAQVEVAEVEKAAFMATMANSVDENSVTFITDATRLENGKSLFETNCAACHGQTGGSMPGGVGPNLVDEYWIHGGSINAVFKTIKYGVPSKGMISWESQFSPAQIQDISSYILSLQGTNPPNAKEPQGELYTPESQAEEATEEV